MKGPPQLELFAGVWRLWRRLDDRRAGRTGRFRGHAEFAPEGAALRYSETGTLQLPGQPPMQASRVYLWRAAPGGALDVAFSDGRAFHRIAPDVRPEAVHDCGPDRYHVRYDFSRWPAWRAVWTVTGPGKDYVSVSAYRPSSARAR